MPKIAATFDQKEHYRIQKQAMFHSALRQEFPKFANAILDHLKEKPHFIISDYLEENIPVSYCKNGIVKNVDLFYDHYQKKFKETGKAEYNIPYFWLNMREEREGQEKQRLKDFIKKYKPNVNSSPKPFVIFNNNHATAAFITHDNKVIMINQSFFDVINIEKSSKLLNVKIIECQNSLYSAEPQSDADSCVLFAFKYLKSLCADDYKLFNQLEKSSDGDNTYILPPSLLRYAQSETVVNDITMTYERKIGLTDDEKQELTDYRKNKYGKFRILYHIIKHFTGDKAGMIEHLKKLTTDLQQEDSKKPASNE